MKLLLHACCGPCSLEPVRLLQAAGHDIAIYYANSNIAPREEYAHRLATLEDWAKSEGIPVIEGPTTLSPGKRLRGASEMRRSPTCRQHAGRTNLQQPIEQKAVAARPRTV